MDNLGSPTTYTQQVWGRLNCKLDTSSILQLLEHFFHLLTMHILDETISLIRDVFFWIVTSTNALETLVACTQQI